MKKIYKVIVALFITAMCYSQIDIKDTRGLNVYVNDTLYSTHKNISNALENQLKVLKKNPAAKVEILPYGRVEAVLSKNFFEGGGVAVEKFNKDTIIKHLVFDLQKCGDTVRFGFDKNNQILHLPKIDSFPKTAKGYYVNVRAYYDSYGSKIYETKREPYGYQPARYVIDTISNQDSISVTRKYFFSKACSFYKREHDHIDSLKMMPFILQSNAPGNANIEGENVRRHTSKFTHRKFQVMALDTITNTRDTLSIQETPIFRNE